MPSNDERREMVAMLRDIEGLRNAVMESPLGVFLDEIMAHYPEWESTCKYLADLIEPEPERTCEMVDIPDGWEDADGVLWPDCWVCDDCGTYTFGVMVQPDTMFRPNYCPHCGAKVVE